MSACLSFRRYAASRSNPGVGVYGGRRYGFGVNGRPYRLRHVSSLRMGAFFYGATETDGNRFFHAIPRGDRAVEF
jgi:hypothetical protein